MKGLSIRERYQNKPIAAHFQKTEKSEKLQNKDIYNAVRVLSSFIRKNRDDVIDSIASIKGDDCKMSYIQAKLSNYFHAPYQIYHESKYSAFLHDFENSETHESKVHIASIFILNNY